MTEFAVNDPHLSPRAATLSRIMCAVPKAGGGRVSSSAVPKRVLCAECNFDCGRLIAPESNVHLVPSPHVPVADIFVAFGDNASEI